MKTGTVKCFESSWIRHFRPGRIFGILVNDGLNKIGKCNMKLGSYLTGLDRAREEDLLVRVDRYT